MDRNKEETVRCRPEERGAIFQHQSMTILNFRHDRNLFHRRHALLKIENWLQMLEHPNSVDEDAAEAQYTENMINRFLPSQTYLDLQINT